MADELVGNTDFGEKAVAAYDRPTPPLNVGGIPLDEFVEEERRREEAGEASQLIPDEPEVRPATQLFESAKETLLFGKEEAAQETMDSSLAANRAYNEVLINNDPESYAARKARLLTSTVGDEAINLTRKLAAEEQFISGGLLDPAHFSTLSPEEQLDAASREMRRIDLRQLTPMNVALIETFLAGGGKQKYTDFEAAARKIDVSAVRERMDYRTRIARRKAASEVDALAAANSWSSYGDMIGEVALQDFVPILPLVTRLGLIRGLTEAADIPIQNGWRGFFIGEARQNLRNGLVSMNPEEFYQAAKAMREQIDVWQQDPVLSKFLTKYNIIETYEATFTVEVFNGTSAKNSGDRFFGNMETLLEGIFSMAVISKGAKGIKGVFNATDAVAARNLAIVSDAPQVAAKLDDLVQADEVAVEFGLESGEAIGAKLPRPAPIARETDNLPEGTKNVLIRSERIRSNILSESNSLTGLGLTKLDRTNAVNREISQLDMHDGMHVQSRMSSLTSLDDGTGFSMRVVVGETAEGGWRSIDDIITEARQIDPNLETVSIMRVNGEGVLEDVFEDTAAFHRAVFKGEADSATAGRILGDGSPDNSFYLAYNKQRHWSVIDKEAFGAETFQSGVIPALRPLLAPNAKFGDEIYGTFLRTYMNEQKIAADFELLYEPFYKLGKDDKLFVSSAFEWMEDFGKNHGRAPDMGEIMARYEGVTEAQLSGMTALREGMDTMHELFNRRLYRDWQAQGFKTARPSDSVLPTFHGDALDRSVAGGGMVLDPVTGKMIKLTNRELDDLYNAGGRVMELDMPVDAANEARHRATRVVLREDAYEVGELSTKPLVYHPGYSIRFYDDPYYIVKETAGIALNGSIRSGKHSVSSEAIRTAGTQAEADNFVRRAQFSDDERGTQGVTFKVVRANDITRSESNLFQKQSIHREGRLFWDDRNFDRLPDVNGNRATLEDPVRSLENGTRQAVRQLTHEDPLKQIKSAWKNDYGDLVDKEVLERFELGELQKRLTDLRKNTATAADKARIRDATDLVKYLRLIEGTETMIIPAMREAALGVATTINKVTGLKSKRLENFAMTMDPLRNMRSVAFNAFMVFRPIRQWLLQSSQIGYLAALRPTYVATPQFFKDAKALQRGLTAMRKSGYDDGFSVSSFAKAMNLSQKEYRVLLREFDRSGLVQMVDVHSFTGGAAKARKTQIDGVAGTVGYKGRQAWKGTTGWLQNKGFNKGEKNNVTFTYNLALKRAMDRKKYNSLLDMTKKDWDDLRVEASNLALGMVRPNNFAYQSGAASVATQFLGFSHKAALGLLGQNPAIKGLDTWKVLGGTYMLYGANMFGGRDWAEEQLTAIGMNDQDVPGTNFSLVDLISGGLIDTTFNMIGDATIEDWKDMDLAFLAPGIDFTRLWEMNLETLMSQPTKAIFGPFGNIASRTMDSFNFVARVHQGMPDIDPADKFAISANAMLSGVLPVYNDAVRSYQGYQMNQWYSTSGEPLPLRPTMNTLLGRALFGARSREEMGYYRLQNKIWEDLDSYNNIVQENKKFLARMVTALSDGTMTREDVHRNIGAMVNFWEEWPEGVRLQMLKDSMEFKQNDKIDKNVYQQLIDTLKDRKIDSSQIDALVDRFTDIPPEQREQLRMLIQEAHESRVNVEAQAFEQLREEQ